ncbi:MAG: flagellar biosynthesis anti-sigma factor FlgM [Treponema sp.]|jgi:negative regulator of flagellin synthesis FlgM|nr:flagellar biosynthesis anti-sigma factor FlgM [Treponema sp.]
MTIDRIGPLDPIQSGKKPGQDSRIARTEKSDSIDLSSEAVEKGELYQAIELVSTASDVRADRVAELKRKIDDPSYLNEAVITATADKILDVFGF